MTIKSENVTVKSFLATESDIDICDDVCEELFIAYCGPMGLTKEGEEHFKEILNLPVTVYTDSNGYSNAVLHIDDSRSNVWKKRLALAKELFEGVAGYCSETDYEKYFIELWNM